MATEAAPVTSWTMMNPCASRWEASSARQGAGADLRVGARVSGQSGQLTELLVLDVELPDLMGSSSRKAGTGDARFRSSS